MPYTAVYLLLRGQLLSHGSEHRVEHTKVAAESGQHDERLQGTLRSAVAKKRRAWPPGTGAAHGATAGTRSADLADTGDTVAAADEVAGVAASAVSRRELGHHPGVVGATQHRGHGLGNSALDCCVEGVDL